MKKEALLYERLSDKSVRCLLCNHLCNISDSKFGFCGVRENIRGILYTHVYAEAIANNVDPIEKKPLYHFFPGSAAYSIATVGCNFKCQFCQNWQISQANKQDAQGPEGHKLLPDEIIKQANLYKCKSISYTYTEPTVFFEYAIDTARLAKKQGLYNNFVTNGYMTTEALNLISPYLDGANVDLKFFNEKSYNQICKGRLEPVLESIRYMRKLNIWVEVTTLVVPGLNDSDEEIEDIAKFLADVGVEIPWHISRFHPDYKYTDVEPTPIETLQRAYKIGKKAGLRYVYLGNVLEGNDTCCYNCEQLLIQRGYLCTLKNVMDRNKCPKCKSAIDGIFD